MPHPHSLHNLKLSSLSLYFSPSHIVASSNPRVTQIDWLRLRHAPKGRRICLSPLPFPSESGGGVSSLSLSHSASERRAREEWWKLVLVGVAEEKADWGWLRARAPATPRGPLVRGREMPRGEMLLPLPSSLDHPRPLSGAEGRRDEADAVGQEAQFLVRYRAANTFHSTIALSLRSVRGVQRIYIRRGTRKFVSSRARWGDIAVQFSKNKYEFHRSDD